MSGESSTTPLQSLSISSQISSPPFVGVHSAPPVPPSPPQPLAPPTAEVAEPSYARSALDEPTRKRILRKLDEAWSADAPHRNSRLTLRSLCAQLRENPHYVSQVISQDLNTSFYELLNTHRVGEAKRLLRESPAATVLAIAMDVGFNSKSAFHAAFRRCTGITPTEFRQSTLN